MFKHIIDKWWGNFIVWPIGVIFRKKMYNGIMKAVRSYF